MDLRHILNTSPESEPCLVDISPQLTLLVTLLEPGTLIIAPRNISESLTLLWNQLQSPAIPETRPRPPTIPFNHTLATSIESDVSVNRKITLSELYRYPPGIAVEYPETSAEGVGHLFELDPTNWINPTLDFQYSKGEPRGYSKKSEDVCVPVLTDSEGVEVPCKVKHATCK
jgi:hypothetical protein